LETHVSVPRNPTDLLGHQTVIYDQPQGGQTWTFRQGSAEVSVTVNGRLRVSAAEGVREAVFAGLGVPSVDQNGCSRPN